MSQTPYDARSSTIFKAIRAENDLRADERLMEVLDSYHAVHVKNDYDFSEKLTWCLENCQSNFRDLSDSHGRVWYFQNDQDATRFAIKWS
jgi:hypothetical protein